MRKIILAKYPQGVYIIDDDLIRRTIERLDFKVVDIKTI
jgi:hypothetical protein